MGNTISAVLISAALETIANSREAKRSTPLKDSVQRALDLVRSGEGGERPREIFEPLRLACETKNEKLTIASLDCISKLISYLFFVEDSSHPNFTSPPPSPGGPNSQQSIRGLFIVFIVSFVHTSITKTIVPIVPHNTNTDEVPGDKYGQKRALSVIKLR